MAKSGRKTGMMSSNQLSLFDTIVQHHQRMACQTKPKPGSFNIGQQLREMLSDGLKKCQLSRYEVAARMSELAGVEITKSQLDSWTAESKEGYRFPAEYLPAFCYATGCNEPLRKMAELVQCYLVESSEALLLELGRINQTKRELSSKEKAIKAFLKEMEA